MSSKYLAAALFGVVLMSAPALAQATTGTADAITRITQEDASQWPASKLIGMNVYNNSNEQIGGISDLLIGQDGKIQALILSVGGFLGMSKHHVAVKFEDLKWVTTSGSAASAPDPSGTWENQPDHAVLNATKDRLKSMQKFSAVSEN
jgi:sporulation protein YlmC with PRC-barrel domain